MKTLLFVVFLFLISFCVDAQHRRPFIYGGAGYTPTKDLSLSLEAGYWGIESSTSFALTYDATTNFDVPSEEFFKTPLTNWIGFKPYFTVLDNKEISLMVYVAPKFQLNNFKNNLIEFGFNPNYKIGDDGLVSLTVGNQVGNTTGGIFLSLGYIVLF